MLISPEFAGTICMIFYTLNPFFKCLANRPFSQWKFRPGAGLLSVRFPLFSSGCGPFSEAFCRRKNGFPVELGLDLAAPYYNRIPKRCSLAKSVAEFNFPTHQRDEIGFSGQKHRFSPLLKCLRPVFASIANGTFPGGRTPLFANQKLNSIYFIDLFFWYFHPFGIRSNPYGINRCKKG